jgi:hypothetical protein
LYLTLNIELKSFKDNIRVELPTLATKTF